MDNKYPILVAQWDDKHPVDLAVCQKCERSFPWDPAEGDPYDLCTKCSVCGGQIVMKYDMGEKCPNCGKLDYSQPLGRYCSRRCQLQGEYAISLAGRGMADT